MKHSLSTKPIEWGGATMRQAWTIDWREYLRRLTVPINPLETSSFSSINNPDAVRIINLAFSYSNEKYKAGRKGAGNHRNARVSNLVVNDLESQLKQSTMMRQKPAFVCCTGLSAKGIHDASWPQSTSTCRKSTSESDGLRCAVSSPRNDSSHQVDASEEGLRKGGACE